MPPAPHPKPSARTRPILALLLAVPVALPPGPTSAQGLPPGGIVTGLDVERIGQILAAHGPARLRTDPLDNSPWIRAEHDGLIHTLAFRDCDDRGANCTSVQFRAWWHSEGAHSLEAMNAWNRERRFGTAWLDHGGNATLSFDVNLAGGVTAVNFDDTLQWWLAALDAFRLLVIDPGFAAAAADAGARDDAGASAGTAAEGR